MANPKVHIRCIFGHSSSKAYRVIVSKIRLIRPDLVPNDFEGQGHSALFSIGFLRAPMYIFGANWVILVQTCDELLRRQARFYPILEVLDPNDLEGQGQSTLFSIVSQRDTRSKFGANLVTLAQKRDELLRYQLTFSLKKCISKN